MRRMHTPASLRRTAVTTALILASTGLAGYASTSTSASPSPSASVSEAEAAAAAGDEHRPARSWFTSWAQSQQRLAAQPVSNQSLRVITHLSQGGDALRIRIQNTFGAAPLTIDSATVGISRDDAAIVGETRAVTFAGGRKVTVPAGGEIWSDAARLVTRPQDDVAVSAYISGTATPGEHRTGLRDNYLTPADSGDHTSDPSGDAYTQKVDSTYLVSAVDVRNRALKGTIVAHGSSVVDGDGSTNCGPGCTDTGNNRRWTDDLARRITGELPAGEQLAVANAGIGGTTSSDACPGTPDSVDGLDAAARLDRDVLALHGVTGVIYYYGTNDLANGCTAESILASYRAVFARLHDAGIKVYVTPITPRPSYSDQNNRDRHTVSTFVRQWGNCAGTCDGVVDFDEVLKDSVKPNSINPAHDTGDGVHANITGQQAIADYISLPTLLASAGDREPGRR